MHIYAENKHGKPSFNWIKAPAPEELATLVHTISHRVAKFLERKGMLERDDDELSTTGCCGSGFHVAISRPLYCAAIEEGAAGQ